MFAQTIQHRIRLHAFAPWGRAAFLGFLLFAASFTARAADFFVFFGTQRSGTNVGFSLGRFDTESGVLTPPRFLLEAPAPAYFVLGPDGRRLYSCNATTPGGLSAYEVDAATGRLVLINRVSSAGDGPCYVSLDRTARFVLAANYSSGSVAVFGLRPDGGIGERTAFVQDSGRGAHPQRQTGPHAHSILTDPSNRFALAPDLGLDKVMIFRFDEKDGTLFPNEPGFVSLAPGSGPRHLKFHPQGHWAYVINELASTVAAFEWDSAKGTLTLFQTVSTLPKGFPGANTAAEALIHPNGKFLYASNRGHDSLAQFSIDETTGRLAFVERVSSRGKMPRNFTFDPSGNWVLCSNHGSDNAVVFRVREGTGRLSPAGEPTPVPYPFCERFLAVSRR